MNKILLIFLGAGLGGVLRYTLGSWIQSLSDAAFPLGTLAVNLVGCAAIGFLGALFAGPVHLREDYRLALFVGLLGGFTTFSTFAHETFTIAREREMLLASLNLALCNGIGLLFVWIGTRLAERIHG